MEVSPTLYLAKLVVRILSHRQRQRLDQAIKDPARVQQMLLAQILQLSGRTKLPDSPTEFADYPWMQSWTREKVLFFETTSGSSGLKKPIPYTRSLRTSFERLFLIWLDDLLRSIPFRRGRFYMSISPQLQSLGMKSDLEYLNPFLQWMVNRFLVTKPTDFLAKDGLEFQKKVGLRLLLSKDLEAISVWSPTAFLSTMDIMYRHADAFKDHISESRLTLLQHKNWSALWPELKLISCWGDGSSSASFKRLQKQFPEVQFQKKGLLATEAPMSVPLKADTVLTPLKADTSLNPLIAESVMVPLWTEVYFETVDQQGQVSPLTDLKPGDEAELLISTKGGLLRYRIGDRVRCSSTLHSSPCIEYVGRGRDCVDLVGEKLSPDQVYQMLKDVTESAWTLVPDGDAYVFVAENDINVEQIEQCLRKSHHYALARELVQLRPARVKVVPDFVSQYFEFRQMQGQKRGDIKDCCLLPNSDFLNYLNAKAEIQPSVHQSRAPSADFQ